ncbi:hypothetical protein MSHO_03060 [Mycobacterium shottsii]|uniref:Uncharacterized protein n=1 Tax=Mycobacterium shottsii TaxID=133549 RepID=A0A7I7L4I4_9MYCO|nr:hypothetical protein MSHO_03060 [Mycobacterium shottsii]
MFFLKSTLSTATELYSRDLAAFAGFIRRSVELMYFLAVPIAVVGVLVAQPLIRLLGSQAFVSRGTPTLARDASSQDARETWSMHHVRNAREIGVRWWSCF